MNGESFRPAASLVRALAGEKIAVGTQNPAKLDAVRSAFTRYKEESAVLQLIPLEVSSGVPDQPIGFSQIVLGARNRARAAFGMSDCALAVGIEDGLARIVDSNPLRGQTPSQDEAPATVFNVGCAWVTDGTREGHGFSAAFGYPKECVEPAMKDRLPIGDLFDDLWGRAREVTHEAAKEVPSGRQGGNIGILTEGRLDRSAYGGQAVLCALIRFLHTDLYD